jgi:hypothetical protein
MSSLFSGCAVFATAVAVGAITTSSAAVSGNLLNRSEWALLPGVHSQPLPKAEGAMQLAQAETAEAPAEGETAAAAQGAAGEEDEPPIDPRATNALIDMGKDLVALQEVAIRMEATAEQVMDSGQKIEFAGTAYYRIRRPDQLRLDVLTDTGGHQLYYDGKTVTLYTPGQEYYGSAEAKATIRDTIEWMEDTYGIETPLADLFDWGTERAPFEEFQFAFPVGTSRVNGVLCGHYAFRTEETDWEVWIELGTRRLPLKFAITDRTQDSLPRFEATLTWSTQEDFDDYIFTFSPSADAREIPLTPLSEWIKLAKQE